jgi:hypothetical protein
MIYRCFAQNKMHLGLETLLRFLFDFALPWLDFRRSMREGNSAMMDFMYAITLSWFRVTGKQMPLRPHLRGLHMDGFVLKPALRELWAKCRICSLLGNIGRDVAWDQGNEFMNLDVKSCQPKDPARIDAVICMLNGIKNAEPSLRHALGAERHEPTEYTPVKASHVNAVVAVLKENLEADSDELFGPTRKTNCPFGGGARPWNRVRNPGNIGGIVTDARVYEEAVTWATARLATNPFPS